MVMHYLCHQYVVVVGFWVKDGWGGHGVRKPRGAKHGRKVSELMDDAEQNLGQRYELVTQSSIRKSSVLRLHGPFYYINSCRRI